MFGRSTGAGPAGKRMTSGTEILPPSMKRIFAA